MRAIQIDWYGPADELSVSEVPDPVPGAGEVLVDISAAGVNFVDVYRRTGHYPSDLPVILGVEAAGRVVARGEGATGFAIGDRVGWVNRMGTYAELAAVPTEALVHLPGTVDDETAAAVLLQGLTAHYLLHDSYRLQPDDTVLVHAGAGGMGQLLIQLAKFLGARVIATASTPDKRELALAAGADQAVDYADVPAAAREFTGGKGVAAVYDGVGKDTFDASLASLRVRGSLVSYGSASGPVAPVEITRLTAAGSVNLSRPSLGHFIASPEELRRRAADVLRWSSDGTLDVRISERYPLADAALAHSALEGRKTTGKLLLIP